MFCFYEEEEEEKKTKEEEEEEEEILFIIFFAFFYLNSKSDFKCAFKLRDGHKLYYTITLAFLLLYHMKS